MARAECEWGPEGARHFDRRVEVIVVVDVLSFCTCIDVAVGRGAVVYPFAFRDHAAASLAADRLGAEVAGDRGSATHRFSLSPASLASVEAGTRILLPSPNGSSISSIPRTAPVLAGCLRNAHAVAKTALRIARGGSIAVVPAGERWPDGSLRPAIEDLIGAGAIIEALEMTNSPEAEVARQAFLNARRELIPIIRDCLSGQELVGRGYAQDVEMAIALNASGAAPLLVNGAFQRHLK